MKKVVVVGCGNVGLAYVNNLVATNGLVNEIVLIDINRDKILGEAMDLNHAGVVFNSNINVKAGSYKDCFNADIVVIAAGLNQEKGETRLDLIKRNKNIIESIVDEVMSNGFGGIFLVATNPVDIMSYYVKMKSGLPAGKVIGTGTLLDIERLKFLLSQKIKINTENIHAYVLGEHGDSSFVVWSKSTVGMVPILNTVSKDDLDAIETEVKQLAYKIINYKDYTNYGVAMCLLKITKAILKDENLVLNVSSFVDDIYIGMPSVVGIGGVKGTMKINFTEEEKEKYENSKRVIKEAIESMEV
ncbi:MAG: L-lactate dehydrogenase [Bacilli bacterium]|nr:L-lactate dehydrogenase [Bacilli bacterium]